MKQKIKHFFVSSFEMQFKGGLLTTNETEQNETFANIILFKSP